MNITVFGGTGDTGLLVIRKALDKGHNVTVFARKPYKIPFQHDRLRIVKGELYETGKIESVIKNADVVISILGPVGRTTGLPVADGIRNIITAMQKYSVKRLIVTTTPSYKDPNDRMTLVLALGIVLIKCLFKDAYRNVLEIGKHVASSDLDWTLVRVPRMTRKPATGKLTIGYHGDGKVRFVLTREDLAVFLLQQIEDKTYIRKAPAISN